MHIAGMKGFAEMIQVPTNPTYVVAKPVDDVIVKDVGEEVMLILLVVPEAVGIDAVVVVGLVICLLYSRMFSKSLLEAM